MAEAFRLVSTTFCGAFVADGKLEKWNVVGSYCPKFCVGTRKSNREKCSRLLSMAPYGIRSECLRCKFRRGDDWRDYRDLQDCDQFIQLVFDCTNEGTEVSSALDSDFTVRSPQAIHRFLDDGFRVSFEDALRRDNQIRGENKLAEFWESVDVLASDGAGDLIGKESQRDLIASFVLASLHADGARDYREDLMLAARLA